MISYVRRISQLFRSELLFVFVFLSAAEFESKSAGTKRCNCHAYPSPDVGSITGLCIIALLGSRSIGYFITCKRSKCCFRGACRGLRRLRRRYCGRSSRRGCGWCCCRCNRRSLSWGYGRGFRRGNSRSLGRGYGWGLCRSRSRLFC